MGLQDRFTFLDRFEQLTEQERHVVLAVCLGKGNKHIARQLNLSVRSIENRRRAAMKTLNVHSPIAMAREIALLEYAGLIEPID